MKKNVKAVVCILFIFTISVYAVFLTYLHFFASGDKVLSGEWTASLDMTNQASVMAFSWLQDIEGVSVTLEDMKPYMQDLSIQVNLTFEQTARFQGTFHCNILPESYDVCKQSAYEAFAMAFQDMLAERLRMAGYAKGTDREAVEALVTETFGMSTVSYLMTCGPALLPSLEELQAQYDGRGTYDAGDGILVRQFDAGGPADTLTEKYIRKDSSLILSEEPGSDVSGIFSEYYPVVYTLKGPLNP